MACRGAVDAAAEVRSEAGITVAGDRDTHPAKRARLQNVSGRATASRQRGSGNKEEGRNSFTRILFSLSECDKRTRPATGNLHRRPRLRGLNKQRNRTRQFSRQKRRHGRDCHRETHEKNNNRKEECGRQARLLMDYFLRNYFNQDRAGANSDWDRDYCFIRTKNLLSLVWYTFNNKSIELLKNSYK